MFQLVFFVGGFFCMSDTFHFTNSKCHSKQVCMCVGVFVCVSVRASVFVSVCLCVSPSISVCLCLFMSVFLSVAVCFLHFLSVFHLLRIQTYHLYDLLSYPEPWSIHLQLTTHLLCTPYILFKKSNTRVGCSSALSGHPSSSFFRSHHFVKVLCPNAFGLLSCSFILFLVPGKWYSRRSFWRCNRRVFLNPWIWSLVSPH